MLHCVHLLLSGNDGSYRVNTVCWYVAIDKEMIHTHTNTHTHTYVQVLMYTQTHHRLTASVTIPHQTTTHTALHTVIAYQGRTEVKKQSTRGSFQVLLQSVSILVACHLVYRAD